MGLVYVLYMLVIESQCWLVLVLAWGRERCESGECCLERGEERRGDSLHSASKYTRTMQPHCKPREGPTKKGSDFRHALYQHFRHFILIGLFYH